MNFKEVFRKDGIYDNIKCKKKHGFIFSMLSLDGTFIREPLDPQLTHIWFYLK